MTRFSQFPLLALFACLSATGALMVGCQPKTDPPAANAPAADDHDHDHDHDHAHEEMGPHGGHLVDLEPSGRHAEWTHDDDTHLITVYLDEFDAEKVTSAMFTVDIPDAEPEQFELSRGDDGWTITSEALMTHLNMGEAATVKLVVEDESGEHSAKMEPHEHHHH